MGGGGETKGILTFRAHTECVNTNNYVEYISGKPIMCGNDLN